ncbi:MAG TPA: MMPL family transporter [Candidatus Polarisedimenticolaceae bacterium]|nr:MMPL family transporter [Candidatus Polarisedimenticolaceae bacterium]
MTAAHDATTPERSPSFGARLARLVVERPWIAILPWLLAAPLALRFALGVTADNSPGRLIVPDDEDFRQTQAFARVFPEGDYVVLLCESPEIFSPAALARVAEIEKALARVPGVKPISAITIYEQGHGQIRGGADEARAFEAFATGTRLFRTQGLVGDGTLGIPMEIEAKGRDELQSALAAIDAAAAPFAEHPAPLLAVRKIGGPYVDRYLSEETQRSTLLYMPLFGLFIVALNLFLYRSFRTLFAFALTIAATILFTEAFAGVMGYVATIVSSLVPLTVLITCTATLVYIHSLYVACPEGVDAKEHQIFTLRNKFLPCTASIFAAAVGFAALSVSGIRPIREMGLWVAAGMVLTWIAAFTLFPALERRLRTPTQAERKTAGAWWPRIVDRLPAFTYRYRRLLVSGALIAMAAGLVALLGVPGRIDAMRLETDSLDYIDKKIPLYQDTRRFEATMGGLAVVEAWVRVPGGRALDPEVLRGMDGFARALESDPRVASAMGPTTPLRLMRYLQGQGDTLPQEPAAWPKLAGDLEQLVLQHPELRSGIDVGTLENARLRIVTRRDNGGYAALQELVAGVWSRAQAEFPALKDCTVRLVGQGLLQAKIAHYLVPTLTESFAITAAIIFMAFLVVFRSPAARLMAMIPSVFAILVMFLVMRVSGIALNVATILIASTVLGASENDQIHFFFHFQEGRKGGTEHALRHALLVSGRAIVFATMINAGGFLALALSPLPPMRQFGIMASSAFLLSMIADFTALPAALWLLSKDKPTTN